MYVKFAPRDLKLGPYPHTPQALILVEWQSHQECAVVFFSLNLCIYYIPTMYNKQLL